MSRVVLSTLGSLGDLHPLIAVGLKLRERGHTVSFCASAGYRAKIESLGFGFDPLAPDITTDGASAEKVIKEIMDPRRGVESLLCKYLFPQLRATYADLLSAVTANGGADLLVSGELVYPAPLIAEKTGLRWASSITTPMSFFSAYDPPILPPAPGLSALLRRLGPKLSRLAIRLVKFTTRTWSRPVRRLRAELGLPLGPDPIYEGKHSPELVLALFSSVLASPLPDWPPNTVITGFPFYDGAADETSLPAGLEDFLNVGEPPIVFTLGSSAVLDPGNFYHASAQAAHRLKKRAILLLGRNPAPANLPENVTTCGYVRFSELFPRAAAVVHQGGIGTVGQTLLAGCPMLIMPYNYDQPDNAARIVRLGAGRTISRQRYTAKAVARELTELLGDSNCRRRAMELGRLMQAERGASAACDALDRLLLEPKRPRRKGVAQPRAARVSPANRDAAL